jgi:hypothetical protein
MGSDYYSVDSWWALLMNHPFFSLFLIMMIYCPILMHFLLSTSDRQISTGVSCYCQGEFQWALAKTQWWREPLSTRMHVLAPMSRFALKCRVQFDAHTLFSCCVELMHQISSHLTFQSYSLETVFTICADHSAPQFDHCPLSIDSYDIGSKLLWISFEGE